MTGFGHGRSLCQEAQEYYYELLGHHDRAVPEAIARHVEGCSFCQQEIRRLGDTLSEAGDPSKPSAAAAQDGVLSTLSRHFEFLGEHVRCSHVRPFLPDLLAPSPAIRIPTPITVHVEKCPQCRKDLAALGELHLTAGQLMRLGEFYRQAPLPDPSHDGQMQSAATALAEFSFDGATPGDLGHVSCCPQCQSWIRERRALATADLDAKPAADCALVCSEISTADLFDFVVPFGLDAVTIRKTTGRRDAIGTHVRRCRACSEKVQSLSRTIEKIAGRADSAVCTVYQCEDNAHNASEAGRAPAQRHPINVQVIQDQPMPAGEVAKSSSPRSRIVRQSRTRSTARPLFFKGAASLATAAVLMVGLSFLMSTHAAKGTNLGEINQSVRRAPNVHVKSFTANDPEPTYEMWVSRDLNQYAMRTAVMCEVTDLNEETRILVDPDGRPRSRIKLEPKLLDLCRTYMNRDILFADAPADGELSEVKNDPGDPSGARWMTYEITRESRSSNGVSEMRLWKVFIDPARKLPVRAEYFRWGSEDWERTGTIELTYPTKAEMESKFKELAPSE